MKTEEETGWGGTSSLGVAGATRKEKARMWGAGRGGGGEVGTARPAWLCTDLQDGGWPACCGREPPGCGNPWQPWDADPGTRRNHEHFQEITASEAHTHPLPGPLSSAAE